MTKMNEAPAVTLTHVWLLVSPCSIREIGLLSIILGELPVFPEFTTLIGVSPDAPFINLFYKGSLQDLGELGEQRRTQD